MKIKKPIPCFSCGNICEGENCKLQPNKDFELWSDQLKKCPLGKELEFEKETDNA